MSGQVRRGVAGGNTALADRHWRGAPRPSAVTRRIRRALAPIVLIVGSGAAMLVGPVVAKAAGYTGFVLDSEVGNSIGGGQLWESDPGSLTATAVVTGSQTNVTVSDGAWTFTFQSLGPTFALQTYTFAPADIDVSHNGVACTNLNWAFQVLELPVTDGSGNVSTFAADFRLRCGVETAFLHGSVRVGSSFATRMIRVAPSTSTLPATVVGDTSATQTVTVSNVGGADVALDAGSTSGTNPGDFSVDDGCGVVSLDPGQNCTISIAFSPTATTTRSATFVFGTDTLDATRTVKLTGYGVSQLTLLPSALVVHSRGGSGEIAGDFRFEPAALSASSSVGGPIVLAQSGWSLAFWPPAGGSLADGTYDFTTVTPSGGLGAMSLTAAGMGCTGSYHGSFTVLEGPVIDTDGTILQLAIDFRYSCGADPDEVRGWVRFHSEEPVPTDVAPAYSIERSATAVKVGDTVTLTPHPVGTDLFRVRRCTIVLERGGDPVPLVWASVSSDDCAPWTFTMPSTAPGDWSVRGYLQYGESRSVAQHFLESPVVNLAVVAGGTPVPFTSNYPVGSWTAADSLADPTPEYGSPQTIRAPAGAESCRLSWFGGYESASTTQDGDCGDWTFTVPEPTPDTVASLFGTRGDVRTLGWSGVSDWTDDDPDHPFIGARRGETYNVTVPEFTGSGGAYTSNLPAIFSGAARGEVFYATDSTPRSFSPVVVGLASGSCTEVASATSVPIAAGACAPYTLPPPEGSTNEIGGPTLELRDAGGHLVATSSTSVGYVAPLAPLTVAAPPTVVSGSPFVIGVSDSAGVPVSWSIDIAPPAGSTVTTAGSRWTESGAFVPSISASGGSIDLAGPALSSGSYEITATYTDVKGSTATMARSLTVAAADTIVPTATAPVRSLVAGKALSAGLIPLHLSWTGTDSGSGVARYELAQSRDDGAYASVSTALTSAAVDRSLLPGHRYRFRVRAVDRAGNVGAWAYGTTFRLSAVSQSSSVVHYEGAWTTSRSSTMWWGGTARSTSTRSSTVRYTFTGKSIAWVGLKAVTRGKAYVYVNGVLKATIDTSSASTRKQIVIWAANYTTVATRTITIKVLGTSGRPRVDVDGFIVAS